MSMLEQFGSQIPEPYPIMHKAGYTPYEILAATSRKMYNDHMARKEEAAQEFFVPTINFKTTVKIK